MTASELPTSCVTTASEIEARGRLDRTNLAGCCDPPTPPSRAGRNASVGHLARGR